MEIFRFNMNKVIFFLIWNKMKSSMNQKRERRGGAGIYRMHKPNLITVYQTFTKTRTIAMDIIQRIIPLLSFVIAARALSCWICDNAMSNDDCIRRGRLQRCQSNERACHNEVRRGSFGTLVTKRCKQAHACDNNFIQNPRAAWSPSQCNSRSPSSVCRCCCDFDNCNRDALECPERPTIRPRLRQDNDLTCFQPRIPRNGAKTCAFNGVRSPSRGKVVMGTECIFSCIRGYQLVGSRVSLCDRDPRRNIAKFNRRSPRCQPNQCLRSQVAPSSGSLRCSNGNDVGSVCSFECDDGYSLVGSSTTICRSSREWSDTAPACTRVTCDPPQSDPQNGLVTCTDFSNLLSVCRFECNPGYVLIGSPISLCAEEDRNPGVGTWTSSPPTCEPIRCLEPEAPQNGISECSGNVIGDVCGFACNPGFYIDRRSTAICENDGNDDTIGVWSASAPNCQAISCFPEHTAPPAGSVTCSNNNLVGSECAYSCDDGLTLTGSPVTVCLDDDDGDAFGAWSSAPPTCNEPSNPSCSNLTSPENGLVSCDLDFRFGSRCTYTCNEGYRRVGEEVVVCEASVDDADSVEWSSLPPSCEEIICPEFDVSPNGSAECSGQGMGSVCEFTCAPGFFIVGSSIAICEDGGEWSSSPPSCQAIVCESLETPGNGKIDCSDGDSVGSVCAFECDEADGFMVYPPESIEVTCLPNSTWDRPTPCCSRRCPPYAVMDLVLVLDSSSSIGDDNWEIMKSFIRSIIESFAISSDFTRISVVRYNREVDERNAIFLKDFPDNQERLLEAFDAIPYNGKGTRTGNALRYVSDVLLQESNGDRLDVRDVVMVITDGRAQDGDVLREASLDLRAGGALTYAIGVTPPRGMLDRQQLLDIAGSESNLLIAEAGFTDLDETLILKLNEQICENRCESLSFPQGRSTTPVPVTDERPPGRK